MASSASRLVGGLVGGFLVGGFLIGSLAAGLVGGFMDSDDSQYSPSSSWSSSASTGALDRIFFIGGLTIVASAALLARALLAVARATLFALSATACQ